MQIWQGESHFSQKWPLLNVGESGKSPQHGLANVGESGESRIFLKTAVLASTRTRKIRARVAIAWRLLTISHRSVIITTVYTRVYVDKFWKIIYPFFHF